MAGEGIFRTIHSLKSNTCCIGVYSLSDIWPKLEMAIKNTTKDKLFLSTKVCLPLDHLLKELSSLQRPDAASITKQQKEDLVLNSTLSNRVNGFH
jgi:HPt (histidine-containing phosphotransfer) domain-containing protein